MPYHTWNVKTLTNTGKVEEPEHDLTRYRNILGLWESLLLKAGEKSTQESHRLYWSGPEDTHEQSVGFFAHKNIVNCVMNCCPIPNRLFTIRLRASPFNITIIQAYAPTSINQTSIASISPAKRGSVARQPKQCSAANSRKQFRNIYRPWGVTVSMGERPNQRDVSSDIS